MPALMEKIDIPELGPIEREDISIEWVTEFLASPRHRYALSNGIVVRYLSDLMQPGTTEAQWQLGRQLAKQLRQSTIKNESTRGRPTEFPDRAFLCCFIEWCIEIEEMGTKAAIQKATDWFQVPASKLRRWYLGGKGAISGERMVARLALELLEQLRDVRAEEVLALIPEPLKKRLETE